MTIEQLIAEFRSVLQDVEAPYLWSNDDICLYLTDAINEACVRACLIEDRTTPSVCSITTVAGTDTYAKHASIHKIKRVAINGGLLRETSIEYLDAVFPGWESQSGRPYMFLTEGDKNIRLFPTPDDVYTVALTVYRIPITEFTSDDLDVDPEIPAYLHMQLMPWVYRCALLKQDAETSDKARAAEYEGIFVASFGQRIDANIKRKQRDKRPPVVSMQW